MLKRLLIGLAIVALAVVPAAAENKAGAFTLTPMVGGHVFEGNQDLDDSSFWGLGLGVNLTERWGLEAVYTEADADGDDGGVDSEVTTLHLDALYHFNPQGKLVPYLAAGLGGIFTDPDEGDDRDRALFNYGAGVKYFVLDDLIALRADVRHLVENHSNLQYSAGLLFQLGAPAATPEPVAEPVAPAVDSDGDGVIDELDKCPNTPAGAAVNADGCPLDSDNDGVFDYMDKCPGTPAGVSVDSAGCPTVLTLRINFGHDSSVVGPAYDGEVAKAAQCINDYPGNVVFIDGHTDSTGKSAYNQQLSVQRAQAVAKRLEEKFNIPAERMNARGFGEDKPVADNKTAEGRALNRRVEVACGAK